jgi:hypothetical protein
MSHHQALVLARSGRMREARTFWERAIASARLAGDPETASIYAAAETVCEAHFGNQVAAKNRARAALEPAKGRDVVYAAAFSLALSGDVPESQRLAADLDKRFPEDTPVQFEYLPILRALSALDHRAPLEAVAASWPRLLRSFKRCLITVASFLPIRSAPWRTVNLVEPTLSRAK